MKQIVTQGIVLRRTDYGEADRILTLLSPDQGKLSLMAKGVRRPKSKLAGGIELFSVSHITFIKGRSDMGTLISSRLDKHYGGIVKVLDRTMLGYEVIQQLNRATEDNAEPEYFHLLHQAFEALENHAIPLELIKLWFGMQLLRLGGHTPNLETEPTGERLAADRFYTFSFDDVAFTPHPDGRFTANHIKFLRLGFMGHPPATLMQVQGSAALAEEAVPLVQTMVATYIRL
jgi:DNA repair protein RecO (recombination protein O)